MMTTLIVKKTWSRNNLIYHYMPYTDAVDVTLSLMEVNNYRHRQKRILMATNYDKLPNFQGKTN